MLSSTYVRYRGHGIRFHQVVEPSRDHSIHDLAEGVGKQNRSACVET